MGAFLTKHGKKYIIEAAFGEWLRRASDEAIKPLLQTAVEEGVSYSYGGFLILADFLDEHGDFRAEHIRNVVAEIGVFAGVGHLHPMLDLLLPFVTICLCPGGETRLPGYTDSAGYSFECGYLAYHKYFWCPTNHIPTIT